MEDSKTISQNSTQDNPQSLNNVDQQMSVSNNKHKKKYRLIIMLIIIIIALVLAFVWWQGYRKYITTDDANLDSYRIDIAPQVTGLISKLYVNEGDTVKKGDLLFEIDKRAVHSRLEESEAQYKQMLSQISVAEANLIDAENRLELARVAAALVKKNYERAKIQYQGDVITLEEFQSWQENQKSAQLKVEIAQTAIESSKATFNAAVLAADASKANVATMQTDISYYNVRAFEDGIIGKRWLLAGDIVNAGQNVYTLNKGKDIWLSVYLEETKFNNIYLGQNAKFSLDAFDKLTFYGKIYYIGDNAASEFALVPPSNASGNYTKVTQRIPIKISIDKVDGDKKQLDNYKLVSGMSANVKIIKE